MTLTYSLNWLKSDLRKAVADLNIDHNRIDNVLEVAYRYHDGQFREHKDGATKRVPYITHPVGVSKICAELWPHVNLEDGIEDILAVALTHDLLEDTSISIQELGTATSPRAAELVRVLTKPVSTGFTDRSARNRAFLSVIANAGASAKFVKLCDALHNLSRPDSMPTSLLKKTIRKAKRDYLPLTIEPHFSTEIRNRFESAIKKAENSLVLSSERIPENKTLEGFLGYCVDRASGKVLEEHDILDILLEIPGLSMVHEGTVLGFEKAVLSDWLDPKARNRSGQFSERLLENGELVLTGNGFTREMVQKLNFQKIVLLPFEGPVRDLLQRQYFFLGCDSAKCPPWTSVPCLRAAIAILSERQRERSAKELENYSEWVATSGLEIDPRAAAELRMTPEKMEHLARLIDAATIEVGAILAAVEMIGRGLDSMGGILLREHRIKDAKSAATKLARRFDGDVRALDDTIGIRVVLLNEKAVARFVALFQTQCADSTSVWNVDMGLTANSGEVLPINSVSGYRATHLRFRVKNALESVGDVACEIQLRTVFQDAWARIAHEVQYKPTGRGSRILNRNLKNLSQMCDDADQLLDNLMT